MKVFLVQYGLYNDFGIESVWEDVTKAKVRRDSLIAQGFENCKVIPHETSDQVTDEYWCYKYVADIDYNFKTFYVNNIILDTKDRIYKIPIKKDTRPEEISSREVAVINDLTVVRITSYKSKEHCYQLLKKEYEDVIKKFEFYKMLRKQSKTK